MEHMWPQRDNDRTIHQAWSDWGRGPQLWVWKRCSRGLEFYAFFKTSSLFQWVDCLQPLFSWFWIWKRKLSDICIFSIHRTFCRPQQGRNEAGTLSWRKRLRGFQFRESKVLNENFQGNSGALQEVSAQRGICKESFDVGKSAFNSLALRNIWIPCAPPHVAIPQTPTFCCPVSWESLFACSPESVFAFFLSFLGFFLLKGVTSHSGAFIFHKIHPRTSTV